MKTLSASRMSQSARRSVGFTLVELLVVIGIIALLISILLPSLGAARRSAKSIKCLAALKEIGNGFQMYAVENRGYFPVAVHLAGNPRFPINLTSTPSGEIRWTDQLSRYVSREVAYDKIHTVRQNSVLWGCPEWDKAMDGTDATFADRVQTGYAMNYYAVDATLANLAYIASDRGRYLKATEWTKQSDRALVADGVTHILQASAPPFSSASKWHPLEAGETTLQMNFHIDGRRHGPTEVSRAKQYRSSYINMLYVDGHAATTGVRDAYNAVRYPGERISGN